MIVCGVDIKGKEAILALVTGLLRESVHVRCATKKLTLLDDRDVKSLIAMKSAIEALAQRHKVDLFVIKCRQATGPRAGGGITFKIETLFQLSATPVVFISAPTLAKFTKSHPSDLPATVVGYQSDAYQAAVWRLPKE